MSDQVATPAFFSLAGRWPQFPSFSQPSESSKTIRLQVPHWKKKTKTNCKTVQKCAHPWISWIFNGIKWSIICAHHASWALSDDRHGQLHTLRSAASSAFANSSLASWTRQWFIYHGPSKMWPFLAMFFATWRTMICILMAFPPTIRWLNPLNDQHLHLYKHGLQFNGGCGFGPSDCLIFSLCYPGLLFTKPETLSSHLGVEKKHIVSHNLVCLYWIQFSEWTTSRWGGRHSSGSQVEPAEVWGVLRLHRQIVHHCSLVAAMVRKKSCIMEYNAASSVLASLEPTSTCILILCACQCVCIILNLCMGLVCIRSQSFCAPFIIHLWNHSKKYPPALLSKCLDQSSHSPHSKSPSPRSSPISPLTLQVYSMCSNWCCVVAASCCLRLLGVQRSLTYVVCGFLSFEVLPNHEKNHIAYQCEVLKDTVCLVKTRGCPIRAFHLCRFSLFGFVDMTRLLEGKDRLVELLVQAAAP